MKRMNKALALALGALLTLAAPLATLAIDVDSYAALRQAASNNETVINIIASFSYDGGGAAVFNQSVTINGNDFEISGNGTDKVRLIEVNGDVTIENLTLTGGNAQYSSGGALYVQGNAEITNCTFTNNEAGNHGGAVYVTGNVEIADSTFSYNTAGINGGGLYVTGEAVVSNTVFDHNTAGANPLRMTGYGGGAYVDGDATFTETEFNDNKALKGGGVSAGSYGTTSTFTDTEFNRNEATEEGGGVLLLGTGTFTNTEFNNNEAGIGGGIHVFNDATFTDTEFNGNEAQDGGGAYFSNFASGDFTDTTFEGNNATSQGGAVFFDSQDTTAPSTIRDSDFYDNTSPQGSSIYSQQDLTLEGTNYFDGNTPGSGNAPTDDPSGSIFMDNNATLTVPDDNIILGIRPMPVPQPQPQPRGGSGGGSAPGRVASVPLTGQPARIGNCDAWVNVREGSTEDSDIIGRAYLGETIWLLQWNSDGTRCKALYNGRNNAGWVSGQFIIPQ